MNKNDVNDRREKAISACLDQFVEKGLYETTSRDLSNALKLQSGGMYQYFANKDEAVLVCAEEAAFLLEKYMVLQALREADDIDRMFDSLIDRAKKLSHIMSFLVQVCSVPKYREEMVPVLGRLNYRYGDYCEQFSAKFGCPIAEFEPLFYMCVSVTSNYMIFGDINDINSQMEFIRREIKRICNR